jgi:hypothetical protein
MKTTAYHLYEYSLMFQTMSSKFIANEKKISNECLSSSTLEIVIDNQSDCNSTDEDSNNQIRYTLLHNKNSFLFTPTDTRKLVRQTINI